MTLSKDKILELKKLRETHSKVKLDLLIEDIMYKYYAVGALEFKKRMDKLEFSNFNTYLDENPEVFELFDEVTFSKYDIPAPYDEKYTDVEIKFKEI